MGKIIQIRDKELADILTEGIFLIQTGCLTGFNFDKPSELETINLYVQYYHNVEEHIGRFLAKICDEYLKRFRENLRYEQARKWGIFKWESAFDDEPGNKYYVMLSLKSLALERIPYIEAQKRAADEVVLAKDKGFIITLNSPDGIRARFLIDFVRKYCYKYLIGGSHKNPNSLDKYTHVQPLFILRDDENRLLQKSDLELVYQLQIRKSTRQISFLVTQANMERVHREIIQLPCQPRYSLQKIYVDKDFFTGY